MIKISTKFKMAVPNLDFTDELKVIGERIFIPAMQSGIDSSMSIDGSALPQNDPKTIKRKGSSRPLIETGTLRTSFLFIDIAKNKAKVTLAAIRKNIGEYLQIDGIRTRSGPKFYRFFGINKFMHDSAVKYLNEQIGVRLKNGRSK